MRILLAPMEGLLDSLLRDTLTRVGGVDACVTEFIRVTDSLLPAARFHRVVPELQHGSRTPAGVPVRVQLLGSDPGRMAENAARAAALGAGGIDLNFGCPARVVNRHGGGAALLREPQRLLAIAAAVRAAVPATVPVTAKMRLGYDSPAVATACAEALAAGGVAELVVHARTKLDGYRPPAYWEWIARVRERVPIPVVANGEVWTVDDARRCLAVAGGTDLMIGRGAVANPALALMIRGARDSLLPWAEVEPLLAHFWAGVTRVVPPRNRHGRMKQWLLHLSRHYPEAREAFARIRRLHDPAAIERAVPVVRAAAAPAVPALGACA